MATAERNNEVDMQELRKFEQIVQKNKIRYWSLTNDEIQCREVDRDCSFHISCFEEMEIIREHIFFTPPSTSFPKRSCYQAVRFSETTGDVKRVFCRNNDGYYVVNEYFTEGVQYVREGEMHIYKLNRRPLDIYVFKAKKYRIPLTLKTFKSIYEVNTIYGRILPGETKIITSCTYYFVIAPCPTSFIKEISNTPSAIADHPQNVSFTGAVDESGEIFPDELTRSISRNIVARINAGLPIKNEPIENDNSIRDTRSSTNDNSIRYTRSSTNDNSIRSTRSSTNDNSIRDTRSFTRRGRHLKRLRVISPLARASTSQSEIISPISTPNSSMELARNLPSARNHCQTVFAVRKDSSIESYSLRSDSTFQVLQDNTVTGSFAIENDDMDPNVFEYHGESQYIREVAKFKNGSTCETRHLVQRDLLDKLNDSYVRKEKVVVNYFFDVAFKSIESAYKMFSQMRNVRMIGSCVPAIVPRREVSFCGAVSDIYEQNPKN